MKTALITGSAHGIGKAMAEHLAMSGYSVIVHYRNSAAEAEAIVKSIQKHAPQSIAIQADVTQSTDVADLFQVIAKRFGTLDVLINNVGNFGTYHPISEVSIEEFDDVINSNIRATFLCIRRALPLLRRSSNGRIINIGCTTAEYALQRKFTVPYYIAKSGVLSLTKAWAKELADDGITVNAISPGIVENSVIDQPMPMNRPAKYADINRTVDFLLADDAEYVSGANIEVTGAWAPQ